jgi:hypothetical protein
MTDIIELTSKQKLENEIDFRCIDIWHIAKEQELDFALLWDCVRWAYGKAYCDAMKDPDPKELFTDFGYKVPRRMTRCE